MHWMRRLDVMQLQQIDYRALISVSVCAINTSCIMTSRQVRANINASVIMFRSRKTWFPNHGIIHQLVLAYHLLTYWLACLFAYVSSRERTDNVNKSASQFITVSWLGSLDCVVYLPQVTYCASTAKTRIHSYHSDMPAFAGNKVIQMHDLHPAAPPHSLLSLCLSDDTVLFDVPAW